MRHVIHRQISTIQITCIELVWMDDDAPAPNVPDLPLPTPTQAGRAASRRSARGAGSARKPKNRRVHARRDEEIAPSGLDTGEKNTRPSSQ